MMRTSFRSSSNNVLVFVFSCFGTGRAQWCSPRLRKSDAMSILAVLLPRSMLSQMRPCITWCTPMPFLGRSSPHLLLAPAIPVAAEGGFEAPPAPGFAVLCCGVTGLPAPGLPIADVPLAVPAPAAELGFPPVVCFPTATPPPTLCTPPPLSPPLGVAIPGPFCEVPVVAPVVSAVVAPVLPLPFAFGVLLCSAPAAAPPPAGSVRAPAAFCLASSAFRAKGSRLRESTLARRSSLARSWHATIMSRTPAVVIFVCSSAKSISSTSYPGRRVRRRFFGTRGAPAPGAPATSSTLTPLTPLLRA
mmetsp:Transcript_6394/g.17990  ORF Transcript_6394/g.17990 Transcript_6394/m.17990 type:complete len:303 (+) Transcript_6394:1249-2157(+)